MTRLPVGAALSSPTAGRGAPGETPRPILSTTMPAPSRPTLVVADDDADMREYIRHALHAIAHVHVAADGTEALRLARALVPRLVVADVRMPGLDGFALCAALRADAATAGVRVLLVSGEPPGLVERSGFDGCADGFLAKPFNAAGLRAHVAHLL